MKKTTKFYINIAAEVLSEPRHLRRVRINKIAQMLNVSERRIYQIVKEFAQLVESHNRVNKI